MPSISPLPRLSIALFVDGPLQPLWMVEAFARIARSDFADIGLIAVSPGRKPATPWLWQAYRYTDRWLFGAVQDLSAPADLRTAIPAAEYRMVPSAAIGEQSGGQSGWQQTVAEGVQYDVIFVIGEPGELDDGELANNARYGIWRYCFGAGHGSREDLAGWREVNEGAPITESGLRVRLSHGVNRLLYQSHSRTYPLSVLKNRTNLFRKMGLFAERELRMLHFSGGASLAANLPALDPGPSQADAYPGSTEMLIALGTFGGRIARRTLQKLFYIDQWFIAYRFGEPAWDGDLERFARLQPPKDRIWADPFPLYRDGRYFIFFEEVIFASGKGHIAMIEVAHDGIHSQPVKVLECDYHLSYPFLIEQDGDLFMVPESGQNHSVELYRCIRFPDLWRLEKVLLDGLACADATFHRNDDGWWMFVNIGAEGSELYDELHLFHADDLLGEWRPHCCNPVKSDVRSARPAGRLFMHNGALHRPAQICAPLYGSGIVITEVLQLNLHAYREKEIARIQPTRAQGILGVHTMNRSGELNVIDGFARRARV
jgi:hypothetical protein